ncbi:MAG: FHA domain-containing protein [Acidobacteria bacterium]|nr:FHA domain-containing protein [Acidobacteriota bacterium]
MASPSESRTSSGAHRPARDLIDAVINSMRANLEPLKYSTLAPGRYVVYLHPDEYARVEGIIPVLQEQTTRALGEALEKLNSRPAYRRYLDLIVGTAPPVENAAREWQIEFLPDHDGELAPGDILIHSELVLPSSAEEPGAGQRTRRITTVHSGDRTTKREETVTRTQPAADRAFAKLTYQDNGGAHTFDIVRDSVTIGRGGIAYRADVRIDASVDVSREHARIRRDPARGAFFIVDLSTLGTTVNGVRLPRGYDVADGTKKENGVETPLASGARIGLADTIYLEFEILRR